MARCCTWQGAAAILASLVIALQSRGTQGDAIPKKCGNGTADILLIMDCSSSIAYLDYLRQLNFSGQLSAAFTVGPGDTHFAGMVFSSYAHNVFGFQDYLTNAGVKKAILNMTYYGGGTATGDALRLARTYSFTPANGARLDVPHIALLITDGQSNDPINTTTEAFLLKKSGVIVISVGVGPWVDEGELNRTASSPSLVFRVDDYHVLDAITSQLATAVCEEQTNTKVLNCIDDNGCIGKANGNYKACDPECQEGYYYSCSNEYTYRMPCALGWYTSKNGTRFTARMIYNQDTNKCELDSSYCPRDHEKYRQEPPVENNPQNPSQSRPCLSSRESCVGKPDGNYAKCYPECQDGFYYSCSNNETYVMPCALGWYTDKNNRTFTARMVYNPEYDSCELSCTSCPRDTATPSINPPSASPPRNTPTASPPRNTPTASPLRNTPTASPLRNTPTASPLSNTTPNQGIPVCHETADIAIILDSSGSIGQANYDVMTFSMAELTKNFKIGPTDVQISVIVYSTDIHVWSFDQCSSNSSDLYQIILNAPYLGGGTNTGLALAIARTYSFSPLNGARQGVGRVAIVITDGISNDPQHTVDQARQLKFSGVTVVVIGVGPGAEYQELSDIATSPDYIFTIDNFLQLGAIRKALVTTACESSKNVTTSCISTSCIGKANGNYPACNPECKEGFYYSCQNGYAYKMPCALGWYTHTNGTRFNARLVYVPGTDSCELDAGYCPRDPRDHVVVPPPSSAQIPNYNPTCISSLQSCSGKPNGNYPMCYPDCQSGFYYTCSNNETYQMPCPSGWYTDKQKQRYQALMIYDPTSDSCELQVDYCPRGDVKPSPTPATTETPTTNNSVIPPCTAKEDILVILDASASIGQMNFDVQLAFVANLSAHFIIGPDSIQISCIVYSSTAVLHFGFNTYTDNTAVWQAFLTVPYFNALTDTAAALSLATDVAFSSANGARPGAGRTVIILTDGVSRNPPATALEADRLKRSGAVVYVLGIGGFVRYTELLAIASSPRHVFNVSSFDALNSIARGVVTSTCHEKDAESSCVSEKCGERVPGTYEACAPGCEEGLYYVCSNGNTYQMRCALTYYEDSKGNLFQVRGVYDPTTLFCQTSTPSCPRDPSKYRQ